MLADPATIPPITYHRHEWRLLDTAPKYPEAPAAYCEDCPATMTREQVEAILNGVRTLTDESENE